MKPEWLRDTEMYGEVELSVQASEFHYCSPKITGLPLEDYTQVEIALFAPDKSFALPSDLGLDTSLDKIYSGDEVAGYVSQANLNKLRSALRKRVKEA
jgi:hypothetical protein